jgi:hypothetical protein
MVFGKRATNRVTFFSFCFPVVPTQRREVAADGERRAMAILCALSVSSALASWMAGVSGALVGRRDRQQFSCCRWWIGGGFRWAGRAEGWVVVKGCISMAASSRSAPSPVLPRREGSTLFVAEAANTEFHHRVARPPS